MWTKTNMAPLGGRTGQGINVKVAHGRWQTAAIVAALRHGRSQALRRLAGPLNGESFRINVEKVLVPPLRARTALKD